MTAPMPMSSFSGLTITSLQDMTYRVLDASHDIEDSMPGKKTIVDGGQVESKGKRKSKE